MKKILLTLALAATVASSFAQGKITLGNDANHLFTYDGVLIPVSGGFSGLTLQLWGGTSAGSLSLQTTIVGNAINSLAVDPGRINNTTVTLTGIPTSTTAFLRVDLFSTANPTQIGSSGVFSVTTGSFAYNSIVLPGAPGNSTWAPGVLNVVVPEPTSIVLAGLGAASLLLFRRRN